MSPQVGDECKKSLHGVNLRNRYCLHVNLPYNLRIADRLLTALMRVPWLHPGHVLL